MSQTTAFEYLRHGQIPFFRLPIAPAPARVPSGTAAVLLGVPFDGGTTYQPGARPRALRGASRERARPGIPPRPPAPGLRRAPRGGWRQRGVPSVRRGRDARGRGGVGRGRARGGVRAVPRRRRSLHRPPRAARRRRAPRSRRGRPRRRAPRHVRPRDVGRALPPRNAVSPRARRGARGGGAAPSDRDPGQLGQRARCTAGTLARRAPPLRWTISRSAASASSRREIRRAVGERPVYLSFDVDAVDPRSRRGPELPCRAGSRRARPCSCSARWRGCASSAWTWSRSARRSTTPT